MSRNKYPEVTVEKILDAAERLFLERGYERTTIQDIVDELGGLTKGAVYHHFKSKEEILDAVSDRMFFRNDPFEAVRSRTDLNGLGKLREAILIYNADEESAELTRQTIPISKNPRLLVKMLISNRRVLTPRYLELIEEGIADGSIHTEYAREISELLPLLTSLWLLPSIYPATKEQMRRKFDFIGDMLERMGLPIFDGEIRAVVNKFFDRLPDEISPNPT
ncbi:MAG TPA: TetR/AcrR family transcriptional regulator [Candidatus Scatomorpha merdigallinarum]|nr:TetR/AcrR family transcriptional regulator [Candidatus Scatomorpha merdigallinarum]